MKQLFTLADRIGIKPEDQFWVTAKDGLSSTLLADRNVVWAPYTAPRDGLNIARTRLLARRILSQHRFDLAISTGSSPGVAFLPTAVRKGVEAHYIESAARAHGPSVSGRIVSLNRRINTYTQYPAWANDRWHYRGSIFDEYAPAAAGNTGRIRRAVVSVGTQEGYGFDRLYRALAPLLVDLDEVLWQTGPQDMTPFGIEGRASVPHSELSAAVREADVVIAHSGTGAAITALEQGKCPVLVPRRVAHNEHVDDHQLQIADELKRRGLAVTCDADELSWEHLEAAAAQRVRRVVAPPFVLDERGQAPVRREVLIPARARMSRVS